MALTGCPLLFLPVLCRPMWSRRRHLRTERIENAGDLLESFLDNFQDENSSVQLQLLTACVKLFLKKPKSTQNIVQV